MKRNLVKTICAFLLLAFVTPAVFAKEENLDLDISQSVNIPGGKVVTASMVTVFWGNTKNGEVDLSYTITVPETKTKKNYKISFFLPIDVQPSISSYDVDGTVFLHKCKENDSLYDEDGTLNLYRFKESDSLYECEVIIRENCKLVNKIDFTITVPEEYIGETIRIEVKGKIFYQGIFGRTLGLDRLDIGGPYHEYLKKNEFAIKIR